MFIEKINKNLLLKPLQAVIGIVERKQPLPILSNVLVNIKDSKLVFTSTDLEIQIQSYLAIDELDPKKDQAITVSAKKFQDILRALPENNPIKIDSDESKIIISAGRSKFSLQTLPAKDFPLLIDQSTYTNEIKLKQSVLKQLFNSVQYAMAQQDIRYYLNGVLLVIESNTIRVIATDGHRLAYAEETIESTHQKTELILSRKTIIELMKLLGDTDDYATIQINDKQVKVIFDGVEIKSKVIDGKFPDYDRVIPKHTNQLLIDRIVLLQALQRAAILSNEKFRGVRLLLTEKNIRIVSSNSEQEEAQEDIETTYTGSPLDIGFNVTYLLDGLNNISEEEIVLSFGDQNSSLLISLKEKNTFKYVVMPMRI